MTSPRILVLGGGITGQLAQFLMPQAVVMDGGQGVRKLTREWGTNYLWEPLDGLECSSFHVLTHVDGDPATDESILRYKQKVGKAGEPSLGWDRQFKTQMTGYNLVAPVPATVTYGKTAVSINHLEHTVRWDDHHWSTYDILVSTIPLPVLISLLLDHRLGQRLTDRTYGRFNQSPIFVRIQPRPLDARFPPEVLYVNYLSDPMQPAYRYCDRGPERHYEGLTNMGALPSKKIMPGKIFDLPTALGQDVLDELESVGIFCFGRFAKWRSDELVHETFRDLKLFKQEYNL